MIKKFFTALLFLFVGAISAGAALYFLGEAPLVRFDNPALVTFGVQKPEVVGFLPYWLLTKADKQYERYITTLTYFGLSVNGDGTLMKLANAQEQEPGWTTLMDGKYDDRLAQAKAKGLKQSLLIISGDDDVISQLVADPETAANNLMAGVAPIMKDKGFTDLNLDIESFLAATESGRTNFTAFVRTVRKQLDEQKLGTLTLDLIPIALVKPKLYDSRALGELADRIVLMTYDYHYLGGFTSGAVAPLGGAGLTTEYDVETAVKEAVKTIPKEKLLLGIPLYGYEWETIRNSPEAATIPGGAQTASVRRVADILHGCATCSAVMDPVAKSPYLIYPENDYYNQIYFENADSMKAKIALAQKYHLGGVAMWALGYEDDNLLTPLSSYKNTLDLSGL